MSVKSILIFTFLYPFIIHCQTKFNNVIVKGQVLDYQNYPISHAKIDLLIDNETIKTINTSKNGNYDFTLEIGKLYILKFHKLGFASKKIEISTIDVTVDDIKYGVYPIKFDISLFEYFPDIDISILDNPVAKLTFDSEDGEFVYDKDYVEKINKELSKILAKINEKKKLQFHACLNEANRLYNENKLEDAILKYKDASNIFPNEQLPKNKIEEISEKIKQTAELEEKYKINVLKGDKNFDNQSYKVSKSYYQKALLYKPEASYPQTRINEIENILAGNYNLINKVEQDHSPNDNQLYSEIYEKIENQDSTHNTKNNLITTNNKAENTQIFSQLQKDTFDNIENKTSLKYNSELEKNLKNNILSGNTVLKISTNENDSLKEGKELIAKGIEYYKLNNFDKALDFFKKAYDYYLNKKMITEQANIAEIIGEIYQTMYRYNASAEWFNISSVHYKEVGNKNKYLSSKSKFAEVVYLSGNLNNSLLAYNDLAKDLKDSLFDLANIYNCIGVIQFELGNYNNALQYYELSLKYSEKTKNLKEKSMSLNNIGNVKYMAKNFPEALTWYNQSIDIKQLLENKTGIAVTLFNIGNVYKKINNYKKALDYYKYAEKYAIESSNTDVLYESYGALAEVYAKLKNFDKSMKYYKLYAEKKQLIIRKQTTDQISETNFYYENLYGKNLETASLLKELRKLRLLSYYETMNKEKEILYLNNLNKLNKQNLLIKEKQVKTQKILLYIVIAGLITILISLSFVLVQFYQKKKMNMILKMQNNEIHFQKIEIEKQRDLLANQKLQIENIHNELTDSIKYASRIQQAMIKSATRDISEKLDSFVLYKPMGVVSGDFYWFYKISNSKIIACVADCTGHGVPGAFMSVLGISLLNEIIQKEKITQPDLIENALRDNLNRTLGFKNNNDKEEITNIRDGLDISICTIDFVNNELLYSGANMPVYITRKENNITELIELKPDKMPIGFYEHMENFTLKTFTLKSGDCLYLFSDGYTCQFGGNKNKKFGYNQFRKLLKDIYELNMENQRHQLEKCLNEWIHNNSQIDDITVVGIRI